MDKITNIFKGYDLSESLMFSEITKYKAGKDKIDLKLKSDNLISVKEALGLRNWINQNYQKDLNLEINYTSPVKLEIKQITDDWDNIKKYIAYDIPFGESMLKNTTIEENNGCLVVNASDQLSLFLGDLKLDELVRDSLNKILGFNCMCTLNGTKETKEIKEEDKKDKIVLEQKESFLSAFNDEKESVKKDIEVEEKYTENITKTNDGNMKIDLNAMEVSVKRVRKKDAKKEKTEDPEAELKLSASGLIDGRNQYGSKNIQMYKMTEINNYSGRVLVQGEIIKVEQRYIEKNDSTLFTFALYDGTTTMNIKKFVNSNKYELANKYIVVGKGAKVYGMAQYDPYSQDLIIMADSIYEAEVMAKNKRKDTYPRKRVELRCHTKMSMLEGVINPGDLIKRAREYNMPGIGITDDAGVQVFPTIMNLTNDFEDFKVLYGLDGFMVNDKEDPIFNYKGQKIEGSVYSFLDIETTGLSFRNNEIIEIGVIKIKDGKEIDRFSSFVNPGVLIPQEIIDITKITNEMVKNAPDIKTVISDFYDFIGDSILVAHNADFDIGFLRYNVEKHIGKVLDNTYLDTLRLSQILIPEIKRYTLGRIANFFSITVDVAHRAVDDVETMIAVTRKMFKRIEEKGVDTWEDFSKNYEVDDGVYQRLRTHRITIFAQNQKGLLNLYRLVSFSHVKYFYIKARILRSILTNHLEGLILGSGGINGEVYEAVISGKSEKEILDIMSFYDFIEVVPFENALALKREQNIKDENQWAEINKYIISLAESLGKIVAATGDVYLLDKEDKIYREIIKTGKKQRDADIQPEVYFRTTNEMINAFKYLGQEKAEEIVIDNPIKIMDMCEKVVPISPEKCPPRIDGSDKELTELVMTKAKRIYGDEIPKLIKERIDTELHSIISNEFAVLYILAHKLVKKSNDDGYMVGSRGSVGSSLVAYMAGISEINSLPPHYICPNCKYSEFSDVAANGYDLPDKVCPKCGTKLRKDGMNIPFETFLGFSGDKEPDIDLNFSSEYQAIAHNYTLELIGDGETYKAGTIGTIAEKTAYGYTKHFFEEKDKHLTKPEIERISLGCKDVKASTGQHPGGIIVLPAGREINEFTPIQRPADNMDVDIITTHFDYHAIEHNLLKLDILGHDNPTILRMLEDITKVAPKDIPLDDKTTMSLFSANNVLNIDEEKYPLDIRKIPNDVGTKGIPEFGTNFVQEMLRKTRPTTFDELIRISGLSHGTNVWLGNAEELINEGICTLKDAICTRDDIMVYLINKGVPHANSFKIMESVRKGRGLTDDQEAMMREHNVPDWYIDSCKKIRYMFPKAHAAAYVTAAFQIAWYKVNYPKAYYATFLSVKGKDFDGFLMSGEYFTVLENYMELINKPKLSDVEKNMLVIFDIVIEMYRRGIKFLPVDLYKSHYKNFLIEEDGIRMPFSALPGLGEKASFGIYEAAQERIKQNLKFTTRDMLREKAKIGDSIIELLSKAGALEGLPESNQISFFEL